MASRRLPQQPTQSGREGLRQARAEQGEAHGRGTEFEALEGRHAPEVAEEDVAGVRRPNEDSNLAPPSMCWGCPTREESDSEVSVMRGDLGALHMRKSIASCARAHDV